MKIGLGFWQPGSLQVGPSLSWAGLAKTLLKSSLVTSKEQITNAEKCTQMGYEVLEGLRVLPKPAAPIIQENQQTDHSPSRYNFKCRLEK